MAFYADTYKIQAQSATRAPKDWTLQGSNDNAAWTVIDTVVGQIFTADQNITFSIDSPGSWRYWKLVITLNGGDVSYIEIREMTFLSGVVVQEPDMLAANNPAPNVVTESTLAGSAAGWKAFDDDTISSWRTNTGFTTGWLKFDTGVSPPVITSLTPNNDDIGATVVIAGSGFGANQGASTVTFNGTAVISVSAWSDIEITCVVPAGATTGNVVVTVGGTPSSGVLFTVHPYIASLVPATGDPLDHFLINGSDFGAAQGGSTVTLNGDACGVVNWSDVQIEASVPVGATDGNVVVTVGGNASNGVAFDVLPNTPTISGIAPDTGSVGDTVTITGTNFGAVQGASTVKFGATVAAIVSWGATEIEATVPLISNDCNVTVTTTAGVSNGEAFSLVPELISISPNSGRVGDEITLSGTGFKIASGAVYFGTEAASIETWSNTTIVCTVPAITNDCNVKVTSHA